MIDAMSGEKPWVVPGAPIYDQHGRKLGTIDRYTDLGIEVELLDTVEEITLRRRATADFGEGYLVWRCAACGEIGDLAVIPDACPDCGAQKEELYAYLED